MKLCLLKSLLLTAFFIYCSLQFWRKMHEKPTFNKSNTGTRKGQPRMRNLDTGNKQESDVSSENSLGLARSEIDRKKTLFIQKLTREEKELFRNALLEFVKVCSNAVTFLLIDRSLLGAYRHHDIIPWDDDVDVLVRLKDKEILKRRLKDLEPRYIMVDYNNNNINLYKKESFETNRGWNWPYLDIFFYDENETHIWNSRRDLKWQWYAKDIVFPLTTLPFMGMDIPVPKEFKEFLGQTFSLVMCKTNDFNHKYEILLPVSNSVELPCEELKDSFYFAN